MIELWHVFLMAAIAIAMMIGIAVYMNNRGKLTPEASAALQRVLAGDIHSADDFYKATAAYPAVKKRYADVIAALEAARAKVATAAGNAAAGGIASSIDHFIAPRVEPKARGAVPVPVPAAQLTGLVDVPAALPGQGIEAYAASIGVDAAAMRLLAGLHPADTWETLADRLKNPSRYFTDADHDTIAAAAGPQSATQLNR